MYSKKLFLISSLIFTVVLVIAGSLYCFNKDESSSTAVKPADLSIVDQVGNTVVEAGLKPGIEGGAVEEVAIGGGIAATTSWSTSSSASTGSLKKISLVEKVAVGGGAADREVGAGDSGKGETVAAATQKSADHTGGTFVEAGLNAEPTSVDFGGLTAKGSMVDNSAIKPVVLRSVETGSLTNEPVVVPAADSVDKAAVPVDKLADGSNAGDTFNGPAVEIAADSVVKLADVSNVKPAGKLAVVTSKDSWIDIWNRKNNPPR